MKIISLLLILVLLLTGCSAEPTAAAAVASVAETIAAETETTTETETTAEETETVPTETEAVPESFLLTFVGDCTLGCRDSHAYAGYGFIQTIGDDYGFPFRNVLNYFESDEMTFINLEGTFCDSGYAVEKAHTFRGPTHYINILTQNSVEAVSLANNHTMDYGQSGYDSTVATLEGVGIPYVERDSSTILTTKNGLTIGIYGAVYYVMDTEVITAAIRQLREQADIVIFAPHWGFEMNTQRNQDQVDLAHAVIDAGADIVWGSHPHVLQAMEEYNGGKIFYSLGNFSFGGNIYPDDYDSALIQQEIIRQPDGSICLGQTIVVPVCVSSIPDRNNFQPTPYEEGSDGYRRVMEKLDLQE